MDMEFIFIDFYYYSNKFKSFKYFEVSHEYISVYSAFIFHANTEYRYSWSYWMRTQSEKN